MALILGVHKGKQIRIGTQILTVTSVDQEKIELGVEIDGKEVVLSDKERTELMADVFAFAGPPNEKDFEGYGRILIEAPRSIRIERLPFKSAA